MSPFTKQPRKTKFDWRSLVRWEIWAPKKAADSSSESWGNLAPLPFEGVAFPPWDHPPTPLPPSHTPLPPSHPPMHHPLSTTPNPHTPHVMKPCPIEIVITGAHWCDPSRSARHIAPICGLLQGSYRAPPRAGAAANPQHRCRAPSHPYPPRCPGPAFPGGGWGEGGRLVAGLGGGPPLWG